MMIKKIMACIMSVCMFMSIICTENISTAKGAESTTVYFLATSEWSEVNAYVYGNAGKLQLMQKFYRKVGLIVLIFSLRQVADRV